MSDSDTNPCNQLLVYQCLTGLPLALDGKRLRASDDAKLLDKAVFMYNNSA